MKCCNLELKVPVMKKCCFCVPIRKGIFIFGYTNLVFSLLLFPFLVFLIVEEVTAEKKSEVFGVLSNPLVHLPLTITYLIVDVVITIILLIGAHKKNRALLRVYLYCGVVFQVLTLCMDLVFFEFREYIENIVYFVCLALNIYLLLLVYNFMHLIEENREVQYVSHCENHNI